MQIKLLLIFIFLCITSAFASKGPEIVRRNIQSYRISSDLTIDGNAEDQAWQNIPWIGNFVQYEPYNGSKPILNTRVKFAYDDNAFYALIDMDDPAGDSIMMEYARRDEIWNINSDLVVLSIDPFNDGQNAYKFGITPRNIQGDIKYSSNDEDENWDAVWFSAVRKTKTGWTAEFKIPYSALRFPKKNIQQWGINVSRQIRRYREWSSLNFINKEIDGEFAQSAILNGISNIKAPLRLSLYPYLSFYIEQNENTNYQTGTAFKYGLDLKYGINESFTLDATLIPDFGQVRSDDIVLNLSPFEVYFEEQRQFFTEGTELFNKAGIFYSRRIGGQPHGYYQVYDSLKDGEFIEHNPGKTNLINASKISGRTKNGLGIGLFNAITEASFATISDSNGTKRSIQTQSLANYNVLVFDQNLKNNSYVSITNTNVRMKDYMANVSGLRFDLNSKNQLFAIKGKYILSQKFIPGQQADLGYSYWIEAAKQSGRWQYEAGNFAESYTYDPNDLGFLRSNNEVTFYANAGYHIYQPFWKVYNFHSRIGANLAYLQHPFDFSQIWLYFRNNTLFKNYLSVGFNMEGSPVDAYDFFEARAEGYTFRKPPVINLNGWISPDYRKKLAIDAQGSYRHRYEFNNNFFSFTLGPRIRWSDRWLMILSSSYSLSLNERGFVKHNYDSFNNLQVIFGQRNVSTITNAINTSYIFTNKSSIALRLRHYYSQVDYDKSFYELSKDGELHSIPYNNNEDINFNSFSIDFSYTWFFAPGSELNFVIKKQIGKSRNIHNLNYFDNFSYSINERSDNSISVKAIYYLDYHYLVRKKS